MTSRKSRTTTVTVYASDHRLYTTGNSFTLKFHCLTQSPPSFDIEGSRLRIDANETAASLLGPFDFQSVDSELVVEDAELTLMIKDGEIEFIKGYYSALPIYSPYHVMTEQSNLYEIEPQILTEEAPYVEGDELLNIPDRNEACSTVRNVESGWAGPVATNRLREWFDTGRLQAAIPASRDC